MKKGLIIIGLVLGVLIVLFDASLAYAETAPINKQWGFSIPNKTAFILRLTAVSLFGGFLGWVIHKISKKR
ncbi:hypothetical protein JM658_10890 [Joostella atrarenae]|uniref:DUF3185 family protein n=1 Tax=Joostella atrarenae TaxID=679257 RepID=A0ABS9J4L7_9FLAO|nr:hypothetical protein [Joostella atrarenae]MCF8715334.1 hypothetical protein [Joostella atrarenae]